MDLLGSKAATTRLAPKWATNNPINTRRRANTALLARSRGIITNSKVMVSHRDSLDIMADNLSSTRVVEEAVGYWEVC